MGKHGPSRGSLAFWRRKRASTLVPRLRSWDRESKGLVGLAGYKAGMTDVVMVDNSASPTKGQEVVKAVTVIEMPPLFVCGVVGYKKTVHGLKPSINVVTTNFPKHAHRALTPSKKSKPFEDLEKLPGLSEVRVLALTQPVKAGFGRKTPDVLEIPLGGTVEEQLKTAKELLGKEVKASDVFKEGEWLDAIAVTTGRGWQGVVKRFGVALNPHKATGARRAGGSLGGETQARVFYTVPRPGQTGFHRRTDSNKQIVKISSDSKILPSSFKHYGQVKSEFLIILGSVPGPAKRLVRLRRSLDARESAAPSVISISK